MRSVIVTGAGGGLGNALAAYLSSAYHVIGLDKDLAALEQLPANCHAYHCDLTDEAAVNHCVTDIIREHAPIVGLVNNAGLIASQLLVNPFIETPYHPTDMFQQTLRSHLDTTFFISKFVAKQMIEQRQGGCITNISSICAQGNTGQTAYSAAKAGIEAFTKVWAKELGVHNIRVNAVAPGFIDLPSTHAAISSTQLQTTITSIPLQRLAKVDEICHAIKFTLENTYLNGAIIPVNGGLTL